MSENQNTKTFLLKDILNIVRKRFLMLVKFKNAVPRTYVISDLNGESITGSFYEKNSKKLIKKKL